MEPAIVSISVAFARDAVIERLAIFSLGTPVFQGLTLFHFMRCFVFVFFFHEKNLVFYNLNAVLLGFSSEFLNFNEDHIKTNRLVVTLRNVTYGYNQFFKLIF